MGNHRWKRRKARSEQRVDRKTDRHKKAHDVWAPVRCYFYGLVWTPALVSGSLMICDDYCCFTAYAVAFLPPQKIRVFRFVLTLVKVGAF